MRALCPFCAVEVQRLNNELQKAEELRSSLRRLVDRDFATTAEEDGSPLAPAEQDALITAMKMEGMVKYGLAYATAATSWDKVRANYAEFAERTDAELLTAFQASGKGISGSFGDLF